MAPRSDNAKGALWMAAGIAAFVLNDTLLKSVSGEVPLFQAIFLRGVIATAVIAPVAWQRGALAYRAQGADRPLLVCRMAGEIGGTTLFLTALFNMPLANATAIIQAAPLAITLAAALFLGHALCGDWCRLCRRHADRPAGRRSVQRLFAGGAGVGAFITLREVATRGLAPAVPSLMVTVPTSAAITAFAGVVTAFGDWQPVRAEALARLAGAAVLTLLGQTNLSRTSQQTGQRRCRRRPSGLTLYTATGRVGPAPISSRSPGTCASTWPRRSASSWTRPPPLCSAPVGDARRRASLTVFAEAFGIILATQNRGCSRASTDYENDAAATRVAAAIVVAQCRGRSFPP
jgi:S-adenosylmethionine uptake transporter